MQPLTIVGVPGSPYSRKLLAVLRYRRIPYRWVGQHAPEAASLPRPRVELVPQLMLAGADGSLEARTDTTPLIRELETMVEGRSVVPADPVVAFLDALIEDYADEWLTKAMFHYRWAFEDDIAQGAAILPRWARTNAPEAQSVEAGRLFAERQVGRLGVVGSNATTAVTIENSYCRLLAILDRRLEASRFVFGARPAAADFALYGQLTQLTQVDPTPRRIALETAPRVYAWVDIVDELSGIEVTDSDWVARDEVATALGDLLREVGRVYAPFLVANAEALAAGAEEVATEIDGRPWTQRPFPYQGKCLKWLREAHAALTNEDRQAVDELLAGTGCEVLFA
jgi:glutathione S-transferase